MTIRLPARLSLDPNDLLRDPIYRRLWISILISQFGGQITLLALPLTAAVLLHASATQMGYLTAAEVIPFAVFSLPTGVWLDRVHKLPVYVMGELMIAIAVTTVPIAWWLHWLSMQWLYLVGFMIGCVNTAAGSAAQIVLTQIVPRARLVEAHAKNALAQSGAEVAGPGAAGALIKLTGAPFALLADALLLLTSATILRGVPLRETPSAHNPPFWPAMRAGLQFVRDHRLLVAMAICVGSWQMCNQAASVVQILFATRQLGLGERCGRLLLRGLRGRHGRRERDRTRHWPPHRRRAHDGAGVRHLRRRLAPAVDRAGQRVRHRCLRRDAAVVWLRRGVDLREFPLLRQSVTPAPLLGRMTSTMRWLILLPAGPGALLGGWIGQHWGLRAALAVAGGGALLLAFAAWRVPVISSVMTLPSVKAEAVTPYSADSHP